MSRLKIVVVTLGALAVLFHLVRGHFAGWIEHMMEDVMPSMIDHCFAKMDAERRELMLAHCRGMLDEVEAKYGQSEPEPADASRSPEPSRLG